MLKLIVAVSALALAGTASAAGWRSLRIDGSSEAAFTESINVFKDKLPLSRRYAFAWALQDIWVKGVKDAEAEQRVYEASDYFRQVNGLGYQEVVTFVDPTGDTEDARRRQAYARLASETAPAARTMSRASWQDAPGPIGPHGEQVRGTPDTGPVHQWLYNRN